MCDSASGSEVAIGLGVVPLPAWEDGGGQVAYLYAGLVLVWVAGAALAAVRGRLSLAVISLFGAAAPSVGVLVAFLAGNFLGAICLS